MPFLPVFIYTDPQIQLLKFLLADKHNEITIVLDRYSQFDQKLKWVEKQHLMHTIIKSDNNMKNPTVV